MGAPKPAGMPEALNSIIAPHEEPAFLTARRYFSQSLIDFLIRTKKWIFSYFFFIPIIFITTEKA